MLQVRTRGGVFGPGGYGGGIFDGGEMGFGGMGASESVGMGFMGLGQDQDYSTLYQTMTTGETPTMPLAPTAPPPTNLPGLKSPDSRVMELQGYLNQILTANSCGPLLKQDGKIGPTTCGTIAWYRSVGKPLAAGTTAGSNVDMNLYNVGALYDKACASKQPWKGPLDPCPRPAPQVVAPTPHGPIVGPVGPVGPVTPIHKAGMSTAWIVGGLLGAAAIAGIYATQKKKH